MAMMEFLTKHADEFYKTADELGKCAELINELLERGEGENLKQILRQTIKYRFKFHSLSSYQISGFKSQANTKQ